MTKTSSRSSTQQQKTKSNTDEGQSNTSNHLNTNIQNISRQEQIQINSSNKQDTKQQNNQDININKDQINNNLSISQLSITSLLEPQIYNYIETIKNKVHQHSYVKIENDKFKFDADDEQTEQLFGIPYISSAGVYDVKFDNPTQYQPKYKLFCLAVEKQQKQLLQIHQQNKTKVDLLNQSIKQLKPKYITQSAKAIKLYQKYLYQIAENIKLSSQKHGCQQNEIEQKLQQFTPNQKIEQMLQNQQFDDQYLTDLSMLPQNNKNSQISLYLKDALSFASQCMKCQYQQTIIHCPVFIPELVTMLITNMVPLLKTDKIQQDIPKVLIEADNSDISTSVQQKLLQQHTTGINLQTPSGNRTNVTNDKHYYEKYHFQLQDLQPAFFKEQNDDQTIQTFTNMINVKFVQQIKENSDINIRLITKQNQQFLPPLQHCKSQFQIYVVSIRNCNQNTLGQIVFNTSINAQNANLLSHYFKSIQIVPPQQVYQLKNQFYKTIQSEFSANIIQSLAMFQQDYSIYTSPKKSVELLIQQLQEKSNEKSQESQNLLVAKCLQNQYKHNNIDIVKECKNEMLKYERNQLQIRTVNLNIQIQNTIKYNTSKLLDFTEYIYNNQQYTNTDQKVNYQFLNLDKRIQNHLPIKQNVSTFDQVDLYYYMQNEKQQNNLHSEQQQTIINDQKLQKSRFGKLFYKFQQENQQNKQFQKYNLRLWNNEIDQMISTRKSLESITKQVKNYEFLYKNLDYQIDTHQIQPQYWQIVPSYPNVQQNIINKFFRQMLQKFGQSQNQKIVIIVGTRIQKHQLRLLIKQFNLSNWYVTQTDQISKFEAMDIKILLPETNVSVGGQVYQLELKQSNNYLIDIIRKNIQENSVITSNSDLQSTQLYPCHYNFIQNTLNQAKIINVNDYKFKLQQQSQSENNKNIIKHDINQHTHYIHIIPPYILPIAQLSSASFSYRIKEQPKSQYIPLCINFINPLDNRFMPTCQKYSTVLQQTLKLQSLVTKKIDIFHKIKQNSKFLDRRTQVSNFLFNSQILDKNKYSLPLIILFQRFAYQIFQNNNFLNEILQIQQENISDMQYKTETRKIDKIQNKVVLQDVNLVNKQIANQKKTSGTYFSGQIKTIAQFYLDQKNQLEQKIDTEKECNRITCTERWQQESKVTKESQININSLFMDEFNIK